MSLRDAINSLTGNGPYVVTRRDAGAYVDGYYDDAGTSSDTTIIASIQPTSGETLMDLPAGQRTDEIRVVYTRFRLRARTPLLEPDTIAIDGEPWVVIRSGWFEAFDDAHSVAFIARTELP